MPDLDALSLESLEQRFRAGLRTVFVPDEATGLVSEMVYIPHFTVPADFFGAGFPAEDMFLGGFLVDRYQASHPAATPLSMGAELDESVSADDGNTALSRAGVCAWRSISMANARQACANREMFGGHAHLMNPYEWASIAYLCRYLGVTVYGNNAAGQDERLQDRWQHKGSPDPLTLGAWLVGCGPGGSGHVPMAEALQDIVGNFWEWVDLVTLDGRYVHQLHASVYDADGISDIDTAIVVSGVCEPENWSPTAGVVRLGTGNPVPFEFVAYSSIVDNQDGTYTLTGCTRGIEGSTAQNWPNSTPVVFAQTWCLVPDGWTGVVTGLNNTTDPVVVTFASDYGSVVPAVNSYALVEAEWVKVTQVNGNQLTLARAQLGSVAAEHLAACPIMGANPNTFPKYDAPPFGWRGFINTLRDNPAKTWLRHMALPATSAVTREASAFDEGAEILGGPGAMCRGGSHADTWAPAHSPLALSIRPPLADPTVGFRACFSLEQTAQRPFHI